VGTKLLSHHNRIAIKNPTFIPFKNKCLSKVGPFSTELLPGGTGLLLKRARQNWYIEQMVFILCGTPETKTRRIPHPVEDYGSHVATPTILSTASFFSLSLTTVYVTKNAATTTQHPHNHKNKIGSNTARSQVALFAKIK
jgi:hypothetical protein